MVKEGLLLFDFDGTLYRGDAPFRCYAEIISRSMNPEDGQAYLTRVERHLAGEPGVVSGDNWEAVVGLAKRWLPESSRWQEAFLETRAFMLTDAARLEVPEGLTELLREARSHVVVAVASNSPEEAVEPLMDKLGLSQYFDKIVWSAGKPEGLVEVAKAVHSPSGPTAIMSVGDNYANDIQPGRKLGWTTAHISPHAYFPGPADYCGRRLEDVMPGIRDWMARLGSVQQRSSR
jgi:FMN phosphatase YigB (HAD superfamily)